MFKKIIPFFAAITLLLPGDFCFSQEEESNRQIQSVTGNIVSTDWVAGLICVRWLQTDGTMGYDNLLISVPGDTKIYRGIGTLSLMDINISDTVTVKYYDDGLAGLKAVSITINQPNYS